MLIAECCNPIIQESLTLKARLDLLLQKPGGTNMSQGRKTIFQTHLNLGYPGSMLGLREASCPSW